MYNVDLQPLSIKSVIHTSDIITRKSAYVCIGWTVGVDLVGRLAEHLDNALALQC